MGIKHLRPDPDERSFPTCLDIYLVGVLCLAVHIPQRDFVIPDLNVLIMLTTLNAVYVKAFDADRVCTKGNEAEKSETVSWLLLLSY